MKSISKKVLFLLMIVLIILSLMRSVVFAIDRNISVNITNNVVHLSGPTSAPPKFIDFSPGDETEYVIAIANNIPDEVNLYFNEVTGNLSNERLSYFVLRVYIDNILYIDEYFSDVTEQHMYTIDQGETVNVTLVIGLSTRAGNEFQNSAFTLTWRLQLTSEIDLGITMGVDEDEDEDDDAGGTGGRFPLIPQTGQGRIIYFSLFLAIAFVLIIIAIVLLKRDKDEEEEEVTDEIVPEDAESDGKNEGNNEIDDEETEDKEKEEGKTNEKEISEEDSE
ncbi:MAG: hypothetical protein FWC68_00840 [Oscillospiraceae bacterium]|nr:hypothetical protein [Oscillospiraceae bacterium]